MELRRRDLLAAAAAAGIGGIGPKTSGAQSPATAPAARKAVLRLSSQEGVMAGANLAEKLDNMERWGFEGLEVSGKGLPGRVKELKDALKGRPIRISAVCAGFDGVLVSENRETRELALRTMKEILTAAGELEAIGLIIVPAFNGQTKLGHREIRDLLVPFHRWDKRPKEPVPTLLYELGEHAVKVGSRILLEPLNREECYFLRQLADAAALCRDINHPGIRMMGDFWHMTWEETSDMGAFISAGEYLRHVHIASRRNRRVPGEDGPADNYVEGFRGLKTIGYQDFVSLECGAAGDRKVVLPAAVTLLREQWDRA